MQHVIEKKKNRQIKHMIQLETGSGDGYITMMNPDNRGTEEKVYIWNTILLQFCRIIRCITHSKARVLLRYTRL